MNVTARQSGKGSVQPTQIHALTLGRVQWFNEGGVHVIFALREQSQIGLCRVPDDEMVHDDVLVLRLTVYTTDDLFMIECTPGWGLHNAIVNNRMVKHPSYVPK